MRLRLGDLQDIVDRVTAEKQGLIEGGLPAPKEQDEPFDMYGEERLGDAAKQPPVPDLSEHWYKDKAFKLVQDYGGNIEGTWEEQAVKHFCRHTKAISGVLIDEGKLFEALMDLLKEKDDRALERDALKETIDWLDGLEDGGLNESTVARTIEEVNDPVRVIMEENNTPEQFIQKVNELFSVQHADLPPGIKKHRLNEGVHHDVKIPVIGRMPRGSDGALCEQTLDAYIRHWSSRQAFVGEPLVLKWYHHPDEVGKVGFSVELK